MKKVYRQGDVILEELPGYTKEYFEELGIKGSDKLEISSETGNKHILNAKVYWGEYVVVEKPTELVHPQHPPLVIETGVYRLRFVRDLALQSRPID